MLSEKTEVCVKQHNYLALYKEAHLGRGQDAKRGRVKGLVCERADLAATLIRNKSSCHQKLLDSVYIVFIRAESHVFLHVFTDRRAKGAVRITPKNGRQAQRHPAAQQLSREDGLNVQNKIPTLPPLSQSGAPQPDRPPPSLSPTSHLEGHAGSPDQPRPGAETKTGVYSSFLTRWSLITTHPPPKTGSSERNAWKG